MWWRGGQQAFGARDGWRAAITAAGLITNQREAGTGFWGPWPSRLLARSRGTRRYRVNPFWHEGGRAILGSVCCGWLLGLFSYPLADLRPGIIPAVVTDYVVQRHHGVSLLLGPVHS